tara:strand:- start:1936 stop:2679 length:744 start_codon:yes stop_codon:yes gene_type:complete
MSSLAIVIPFYNESDCLPGLIKELDGLISKIDCPVSVVAINDGSKDNTLEMLNQFAQTRDWLKVVDQNNGGHGKAVLHGYELATKLDTEWVFQCDSDQQIPMNELLTFWNKREEFNSFLGIRKNRQDPKERLLVSKILKAILRVLFGLKILDANCPFRMIKAIDLKRYLAIIPETSFAPNVFLSVLMANHSKLGQLHVSHLERQGGVNSINKLNLLKICKRCTIELFHFWQNKKSWLKRPNILQSFL